MSELQKLHPCWYMKQSLPLMADGQTRGIWMMYARLHVAKCPQCRQALEALQSYNEEIKNTPQASDKLSPEFWASFESKLDRAEQQEPKQKSG